MQITPDMAPTILRVATVRLALAPGAPAFSRGREAAIAAGFAAARMANPHLFNGGFFLFEAARLEAGGFAATALATDYATFLHWRASGWPDVGLTHVFPVGAVVTADRRLLIGQMGPTTANAGRWYPPSGSFDRSDLTADGLIDPLANILRELGEEVGLAAAGWRRRPGWLVIPHGPRIAVVTVIEAPETSEELARRVAAHLAGEAEPELGAFEMRPLDAPLPEADTVGYVNPLLAHLATGG